MRDFSVGAAPDADLFQPFKLVAIGASAGGIPTLQRLLGALPADFPLPIVVVQHLSAAFESRLPMVLGFHTRLRCRWAEPGTLPRAGFVHVAKPGTNLVLGPDGRLLDAGGPKPPLGWPNVDLFFHSMAARLGPRGIGIILSGMMWDGADGIAALRRAGGATMVQDPRTADYADMPTAAVDLGRADLMLPLDRIVEALDILAEKGVM